MELPPEPPLLSRAILSKTKENSGLEVKKTGSSSAAGRYDLPLFSIENRPKNASLASTNVKVEQVEKSPEHDEKPSLVDPHSLLKPFNVVKKVSPKPVEAQRVVSKENGPLCKFPSRVPLDLAGKSSVDSLRREWCNEDSGKDSGLFSRYRSGGKAFGSTSSHSDDDTRGFDSGSYEAEEAAEKKNGERSDPEHSASNFVAPSRAGAPHDARGPHDGSAPSEASHRTLRHFHSTPDCKTASKISSAKKMWSRPRPSFNSRFTLAGPRRISRDEQERQLQELELTGDISISSVSSLASNDTTHDGADSVLGFPPVEEEESPDPVPSSASQQRHSTPVIESQPQNSDSVRSGALNQSTTSSGAPSLKKSTSLGWRARYKSGEERPRPFGSLNDSESRSNTFTGSRIGADSRSNTFTGSRITAISSTLTDAKLESTAEFRLRNQNERKTVDHTESRKPELSERGVGSDDDSVKSETRQPNFAGNSTRKRSSDETDGRSEQCTQPFFLQPTEQARSPDGKQSSKDQTSSVFDGQDSIQNDEAQQRGLSHYASAPQLGTEPVKPCERYENVAPKSQQVSADGNDAGQRSAASVNGRTDSEPAQPKNTGASVQQKHAQQSKQQQQNSMQPAPDQNQPQQQTFGQVSQQQNVAPGQQNAQPNFAPQQQAFGQIPTQPCFGQIPAQQSFGPIPAQQPSFGQMPALQPSFGQMPAQQPSFGQMPAQQPSFGQMPAQQPSFGQMPAQQASFGQMPAQQASFGQMPAQQASFGHMAAQQPSFGQNMNTMGNSMMMNQGMAQPQPMMVNPFNMMIINGKHYVMSKLIGRGGSSQVYEAVSPVFGMCGVKVVELAGEEDAVIDGYKNEIELMMRLQDSGRVVKLYDYEYRGSQLLVVMERGETDLDHYFRKWKNGGRRILPEMIKFYWRQMLQAVQVLHDAGIVHSDLKPANFLLVAGVVKLIDFGIAKAIQGDRTSVTRDLVMGTLNYLSPESILDTQTPHTGVDKPKFKLGVKSDIWSLGCILYTMVYNRTPFQHVKAAHDKLHAITSSKHHIPYPDDDCDPQVVSTLKRCLVRNPRERASIEELLNHPYLTNNKPAAHKS